MITKADLDRLLIEVEQDRVEKTISINDATKFGEAICSFCNDFPNHNKPGYLIVGVHDDGSRCGLAQDEKVLQTLMDFRTDGRIVPPPVIVVSGFDYPDGYVAVAEVQPSYQPPARFKGKVCIRIGPRKGTATDVEERILSEKRSSFAKSWDTLPCYGSSLKDISIEIFKLTYLPTAIDEETLMANGRDIKEQLASLKFYDLKADCPTNAAILMFGTNLRFFIPGAYIQYVRFTGNDVLSDFDFETKFEGDLTTQMRVINDFITSQLIKKVLLNIGEEHQVNFPVSAIRELLYNAIIHRDYESNAPIKFYEFDDRIEISNAGGLFGKARPENFPKENDYRNPTIAEATYNLGYVNRFNLGVQRASAALIKNGNPEPKFIIDQPTHFEVIIYKKSNENNSIF
jgi:ATP-dependent DNA helicase RecG